MLEKLFKPAFNSEEEAAKAGESDRQQQLGLELAQIHSLQDEQQLCQAALHASFTQSRQAAALKLSDEKSLHQAEKESRDKSVQHIVREKIKEIKQAQQSKKEAKDEIEALCQKMENLIKNTSSPLFKAQYQHLSDTWEALNSTFHLAARQAQEARYTNIRVQCDKIVSELDAQAQQWEAIRKADEAEKQITDKEQADKERAAAERQQKISQETQAQEDHQKQQSLLEQSLLEQIAAIEKNLESGIISNVSKKISSVQKKLDAMDAALAKQHEGKVNLLKKKLNELRDWQSFAALPKKQDLHRKMSELAEKPLPPPEQIKAIQSLQAQWRELKGGGTEEEQKIWEAFRTASDKAYEPCKVHFEQQKELRAENLKQKEKICEELEKFHASYDWDNPDWKAIDKILGKAKIDFFRFSPIDHKKRDGIKKRYQEAIKPLIEKLRPEQQKNEAECQRLIKKAKELEQLEDLQQAIQQAKGLQQQWKNIGITRPKENQKLWEQFRESCNTIFARRNQERDQFREQLQQEINKAEQICSEIEKLSSLNDETLRESQPTYQKLRQDFLGIHPLKKDKQKKLFNRFYKACDRYQAQVAGIQKRQRQASLKEALRRASLCDQLELGADIAPISSEWENLSSLPGHLEQSLSERYRKACQIHRGETDNNTANNEKNRRLILIQLEILLEKPTPEEDRGLRMEYQLQQLSHKGLAGQTIDKKQQINKLIEQWIASSAPDASQQAVLLERLQNLIS
jgi:hypothetical protein